MKSVSRIPCRLPTIDISCTATKMLQVATQDPRPNNKVVTLFGHAVEVIIVHIGETFNLRCSGDVSILIVPVLYT